MSEGRKYGEQPSRPIYVWNGILEPKHRERIGPAIWLFLYFIDRTTKERPNKHDPEETEGWVYGKMPLTLERMAEETGIPARTISRYLVTLEGHDYIRTVRAPHGVIILVQKSSKWPGGKKGAEFAGRERSAKSGESRVAKSGESPAKSGECRKDKAVDSSGDEVEEGRSTAHRAFLLSLSDSSSEGQRQEKSYPQNPLTGKNLTQSIEELAREMAKPKPRRRPVTEAELEEQKRIVRERYPEQFTKAERAAIT